MHDIPAVGAQSWFAAKAAIALGPVITMGAADLIRWFLRRMVCRRKEMASPAEH